MQVGTSLITVPLTLKYLGNERFGLWMTISSVLAMASFADFGVGNGVLNTVAKAFGKDDMVGVRKAVSSGFAVLNAVAVLLLLSFFSIYRFVNWGSFFRVDSPQARAEAGPALAVFAVCFALNISMDVVQRVQLGLQEGYRYGVWQMCGSIAGFIGVLAGIWLRVSLPVLVMVIAGAPIFATALNTFHFFGFVRPDLRPSRELVSRDAISQIMRLGSLFFVLQVVATISYSADNFIVARTLGAADVTLFAIPQRLFSVILLPITMLLAPFWPAYGEASSRGDIVWIRHTLGRTLLGTFAFTSIFSAAILLASNRILLLWVGPQVHPPFALMLGFAIWTVISSCNNTLGVFLNGLSIVQFQVITTGIFGIACLALKIWLAPRYGITGIPWATILAFVVLSIPPYLFYIPRLLNRIEDSANAIRLEELCPRRP